MSNQNLYRSASSAEVSQVVLNQDQLKPAIQLALRDPEFFPDGCLLGFGLYHTYPVSEDTNISRIKLKGADALLMNAFRAVGLQAEIRALYSCDVRLPDDSRDGDIGTVKWLTSRLIELEAYERSVSDSFPEYGDVATRAICFENVGHLEMAGLTGHDLPMHRILLWITPPSTKSSVEINYIIYGNEPEVGTDYADLNIVLTIPPEDERGDLIL